MKGRGDGATSWRRFGRSLGGVRGGWRRLRVRRCRCRCPSDDGALISRKFLQKKKNRIRKGCSGEGTNQGVALKKKSFQPIGNEEKGPRADSKVKGFVENGTPPLKEMKQ